MKDENENKPKYSGYGYHGGGRKATGVKRVFITVSCQPEERDKIIALAEKSGKTISRFLLDLALTRE